MKLLKIATTIFLFLFGLVTIFMGGSVIFDLFGIREIEGNYVLFVVWTNWICGFLYVLSAIGLLHWKKWVPRILWFATFLLILTFILFFIHIKTGGIYETKTVYAMTFRTLITFILSFLTTTLLGHQYRQVARTE